MIGDGLGIIVDTDLVLMAEIDWILVMVINLVLMMSIDLVLLLVFGTDLAPIMFRNSIILVSASSIASFFLCFLYLLLGFYCYLILDGYALEP